jgi:methyl-accepting chemotaxis protein
MSMKNWTIGTKLFAGIGTLVVLTLLLGGVAVTVLRDLKDDLDVATGPTTQKIELARELQETVIRFRSEQRRALLAGFANDPQTVAAARTRLKELSTHYDEALEKISGLLVTEEGRQNAAQIRDLEHQWVESDDKVFEYLSRSENETAWKVAREQGNPLVDKIDEVCEKLLAQQEHFQAEARDSAHKEYDVARMVLFGAIAVALAMSILVAFVVRQIVAALRAASSELKQGSEQVASASSQVSTSAQSLSQGATEQAASLEETSASMEEMASMTRQNAENAQSAASLMGEVDGQVRESNHALGQMVTSMSAIRESSQQVAKIIKTIDEIAFQTNILALNAAVEAARAGEAGMGFAVVADEVRNLAQRSAQAARDTATLIEESIAKAAEGDKTVNQVSTAISGITTSVVKVKGLVEEVSAASRQQTQGIDQVSQAITQMEKVTQTTAATAEESAAASEELNAQADASMNVVARLQALVDGVKAAGVMAPGARTRGGKVVTLAPKSRPMSAEEQFPLEKTGTYGSF